MKRVKKQWVAKEKKRVRKLGKIALRQGFEKKEENIAGYRLTVLRKMNEIPKNFLE